MEATETITAERADARAVAPVLACIAPLFARLSSEALLDAMAGEGWALVQDAAVREAADADERSRWTAALAPLDAGGREALCDELLVPGLPYAVMPVESLYKPWSAQQGNAFGAARGLYLGDPARHLFDVYRQLSLEVPEAFASMPDHLTLELELLSLVLDAGNVAAARQLVLDHLDWLGAYDEALARREAAIGENGALAAARRANLVRALGFLRALVALTERTVSRLA